MSFKSLRSFLSPHLASSYYASHFFGAICFLDSQILFRLFSLSSTRIVAHAVQKFACLSVGICDLSEVRGNARTATASVATATPSNCVQDGRLPGELSRRFRSL